MLIDWEMFDPSYIIWLVEGECMEIGAHSIPRQGFMMVPGC
jgi:hypothetical protein